MSLFPLPTASLRLCVSILVLAAGGFCVIAVAQQPLSTPRPPWTTSRIQGAPEPPAPYRIVSAFPQLKFDKPTCIEEIAETNRLLVTERDGRIFTFPKSPDV